MSHFPTIIDIELTNHCNLACVMCPRRRHDAHAGHMERSLLDRILDEALAEPKRTFRLHGGGEPLLSPLFRHAVERITASDGGHSIDLITNGHLLDRDVSRFILSHRVARLTVSIGAATAQTYELVRQSPGFERVVRNTVRFIGERDRLSAPTLVEVQLIRVPPAHQEVDLFVDFWSHFNVTVEIWNDFNWGRRSLGTPPTLDLEPCAHLWDSTVICWDGLVSLCCIDCLRMNLVGNLAVQGLREAYNDVVLESIRALHQRRQTYLLPLCIDCAFRDGKHVAFSANVHRTGARPSPFPPLPALPSAS